MAKMVMDSGLDAGQGSNQVSLFAQTTQQSLFGMAFQDESASAALTTLHTPLQEAVFTVLDLETTGLNAKRNAITEVAAIQFRNGEEIAKYVTLVKPTEPIPEEVEHITGITNEMIRHAPAQVMALSELAGFIGQSPFIVGHNIPFDIGFLREKFAQTGLATFLERVEMSRALCTKVLAQKVMPGLPSYEGIVVATSVGVKNPNPHRAENDVRMSAEILFALIAKLQAQNPAVQTVHDLLQYQGALSL